MKEEFIPESLARKLLLKGCPLSKVYKDNGDRPLFYEKPIGDPGWSSCDAWFSPTIAQVLKWLREENKVFVLIDIHYNLCWYYELWRTKEILLPVGHVGYNEFDSYEAAAIAGIEYVLDNLI